jgi:ADP-ribose pyrophosphatase
MSWPKPQFGATDWSIEATETQASGFFKLDRLTLTHRGYQTEYVGPMHRELFIREPAVVAILMDPVEDTVVMVEQFRIGAAMSRLEDSPWLLEWVAGICDPGEEPEATCIREIQEETGLAVKGAPELLFTYYPSPGGSTELIYLYLCEVDSTQAPRFHGQAGEHEDLKVHVIRLQDAFDALDAGQVNNAATIMGIQWLKDQRRKAEMRGL